MCTFCDSTDINTIIGFVPHVSSDGFSGGSDSYLQFRDTHAPCLLKLCKPPSNGIVRWRLFPEFGAELPLDKKKKKKKEKKKKKKKKKEKEKKVEEEDEGEEGGEENEGDEEEGEEGEEEEGGEGEGG